MIDFKDPRLNQLPMVGEQYNSYFCPHQVLFPIHAFCSAWLKLKLNTKMGLNHPTTTTPPGTFRPLLDKLGS